MTKCVSEDPVKTRESLRPMLGIWQVLAIVPFSKATLHRRIEEGRFPQARRISQRQFVWFADEIQQWQKSLESLVAVSQTDWRSSRKLRNQVRNASRFARFVGRTSRSRLGGMD